MKAKLKDGYEVIINDESLDDWEFLELLDEVDTGNGGAIVRVAKLLLGDDELSKLKAHLRGDGKRVPATAMINALQELMESVGEAKNS